jgi:LCP family protein required for cell wall assembly
VKVHTRGRTHWRFLLAAVLVIAVTATATAVAGLLKVQQIAGEIGINPPIKNAQVTIANPGNPQTILLIGSDHRAGEPFRLANTDTMMLVRIDPNSQTINVLSIPRDLKVNIPEGGGYVTAKINATYSIGGPNLLLKVLRQEVFPGLHVNHIVDVNFSGFEAMVNAIGCVYTDVDRRYYNNTLYTNYSSIDIEPGYQKLCGADALAFVRFRHTDSDIVRNARQQDFLRWAKTEYSGSQIIANEDKLTKIFGQYAQTDHDLHTIDGLLNLIELVAFAAGHQIKQVPFPAVFLPCNSGAPAPGVPAAAVTPCYVTADPTAEQQVFTQFMTPTKAPSTPAATAGSHPARPSKPKRPPSPVAVGLTADTTGAGNEQAAAITGSLPVYYPKLLLSGAQYCTNMTCPIGPVADSYPRSYMIRDQAKRPFAAYRITVQVNAALGEYYGIEGTAWPHPPILNKPTSIKTINGRQLMLFQNGAKVSLVAWRTPSGVYWISNTLTDNLTNTQLELIAASLTRAG